MEDEPKDYFKKEKSSTCQKLHRDLVNWDKELATGFATQRSYMTQTMAVLAE